MKRFISQADIDLIRELSVDHYVRDISKITGISDAVIGSIQNDPKNNIINPLRKSIKGRQTVKNTHKKKEKVREGFFDVDEYTKNYLY